MRNEMRKNGFSEKNIFNPPPPPHYFTPIFFLNVGISIKREENMKNLKQNS